MSADRDLPAFPRNYERDGHNGMTLRDYFAAHAPQPERGMPLAEHCAFRYRYADQMLKARSQAPAGSGMGETVIDERGNP